jgi:hypothetical protein
MMLDSTISWKKHIEFLKGKLNKACYIIKKAKQYINSHALKMLYYAFFHSVLTYSLIFWGNSTNRSHIFKLQKRVVRIMVGVPKTPVTRNNMNFYLLVANLKIYQKGPEFMGIKVYNNLPGNIKLSSNNKKVFRKALLLFLQFHSFYSVKEYITKI